MLMYMLVPRYTFTYTFMLSLFISYCDALVEVLWLLCLDLCV